MEFDFIIVGSGINSLVAAALLSRKKHSVCILERNDWIGGCIKTDEVTLPGFKHDIYSGFHPLFVTSPAYSELSEELDANGLEYINTSKPTGAVTPEGQSFILTTDRDHNVAAMEELSPGQGKAYRETMLDIELNTDLIFGLLGNDLWKFSTLKLVIKGAWKRRMHNFSSFLGMSFDTCRNWLDNTFQSTSVKACFAPWILHTGLDPDSPLSGLMGKLISFTLEAAGMPIVKGGSHNLPDCLISIIKNNGGTILTQHDAKEIVVKDNIATGVIMSSGEQYNAKKAVICNVTPTQLYGSLLKTENVPDKIYKEASQYKYGNGDMQIHLALDRMPEWVNSELNDVAMVHVTSGINSVSKAVNQAKRGILPDEATIVVGQPTALDPTRAPKGKAILWIQLQELPFIIKEDALGEIEIPENGIWDVHTKEAYADRIINRLSSYIKDLDEIILSRHVLSPSDLASENINLVNGDPYSGACGVEQFMLWRPLKSTKNHSTPVKNLYHIGASTHPGPGLAGTSGYIVSQEF